MSWTRVLDTNLRDLDGQVEFATYCAPTGSRIHLDDTQYCCSGKSVQPSTPDAFPDARICT